MISITLKECKTVCNVDVSSAIQIKLTVIIQYCIHKFPVHSNVVYLILIHGVYMEMFDGNKYISLLQIDPSLAKMLLQVHAWNKYISLLQIDPS